MTEEVPVVEQLRRLVPQSSVQSPSTPGQGARGSKPNHLTLVELQYLLQLGNLPRGCHEAVTFLYVEAVRFQTLGLSNEEVTAGHRRFRQQKDYIETLLLISQSVDGYRSGQLVEAMMGDRAMGQRMAGVLVAGAPPPKQPEKEGKRRGLFRD